MRFEHSVIAPNALARLAIALSEALLDFAKSLEGGDQREADNDPVMSGAESNRPATLSLVIPRDPMTLRQVSAELRLKDAQIVKLRRLWGFPSPVHHRGHFLFSRSDVERWARAQPNPDNLAAVLRLRRRRTAFNAPKVGRVASNL